MVTLRYRSEIIFQVLIRPSKEGSVKSGAFMADSTSSSVILCQRIRFLACLVYRMKAIEEVYIKKSPFSI